MSKLAGVNIVGWLLAALAIYLITFVWYALLFQPIYQAAEGLIPEDYEGQSAIWMPTAIIVPLLLSFGLGWIMNKSGASSMGQAITTGLMVGIFIAGGIQAYDLFYRPEHSFAGYFMHTGSHVITLVAAAIVHSFFMRDD